MKNPSLTLHAIKCLIYKLFIDKIHIRQRKIHPVVVPLCVKYFQKILYHGVKNRFFIFQCANIFLLVFHTFAVTSGVKSINLMKDVSVYRTFPYLFLWGSQCIETSFLFPLQLETIVIVFYSMILHASPSQRIFYICSPIRTISK